MRPERAALEISDESAPPVATPGGGRRYALGLAGPTRVAVVGAGYIADYHLAVLRELPGVAVAAVCDQSAERAGAAAARFGVPRAVGAVEELAGLGVQVAHVLTPPDGHYALTRTLLEMGIGVLVEKPLALSSAEARELAALARERALPLGVNHNNLFHPAFARLGERLRTGRIGRPEHVRACWSVALPQLDAGDFRHFMFRAPGNILYEQAVHPLSLVHALVGPVREMQATVLGSRELHPGQTFHDRWLLAARAERGTAEVLLAFGRGFPRATLEVLGTDGVIEADLLRDVVTLEEKTPWLDFWDAYLAGLRRARALAADSTRALARYGAHTLGLGRRRDAYFAGMRGSIAAFHAALRAGAEPPAGGAAGAEVLAWCDAAARQVAGERERRPAPPPPAGQPRPGEVVLLGGTGFIGRRVAGLLLERQVPVTLVARRLDGLPPRLDEAARARLVRLFQGSLEEPGSLARAIAGARTVVHLATGGGATWEQVERSMVRGSVAVAEACLAAGVERLVYVSSIAALYAGADAGVRELDDAAAPDPRPGERDLYSRGKIAAEQALLALHRERGLPLVIARPGVVLGEGTPMQHAGLGLWVRDSRCIGWGRGDHPLPVVDVHDVADALVRIALWPGPELDGRALNLCARAPLSAAEIVGELARSTGRALHFHPRPLWLSQLLEIGKWLVKVAGRRPGAKFPSYRDLKSRALVPPIPSRTARELLGWRPVEEREAFLDRTVRRYGRDERD